MKAMKLNKLSLVLLTTILLPLSGYAVSEPPEFTADFVNNSKRDLSLRNLFKNLNTSDYGDRSVIWQPVMDFQSKNNRPILSSTQNKALRAQNHSIELQIDYKFNIF